MGHCFEKDYIIDKYNQIKYIGNVNVYYIQKIYV